jgi:hypothetical protein
MTRKTLAALSCVLGAAAVAACSSSDDGKTSRDQGEVNSAQLNNLFDVNDVSLLLPIVATPSGGSRAVPDVPMTDGLWKASHHQQVMAKAQELGLITLSGLETFRPVGVRFDPCAPGFAQAARDAQPGPAKGLCLIQFRLIVQPIDTVNDQLGNVDVAAHLVFTLGASPLEALPQNPIVQNAARLLGNVKAASRLAGVETAGKTLGVHPGLATGDAGVADAVRELITACTERACGDTPQPARRAIAFMGLKGNPEPWTFLAGQVDPATDAWSVGPIPRLEGAVSQDLDFLTGAGPIVPREDGNQTKGTPVPRSLTPLLEGDNRSIATRAATVQIENPQDTHFFNASCASSCHSSSAQIFQTGVGGFIKNDGTLDPQGAQELAARAEVPKGITGFVARNDAQTNRYNTRNFGYFQRKPTVSGRTVNESVEVVDFLNTKLNPTFEDPADPSTLLHGPGPDCSGVDAKGVSNAVKVFLCLRDGRKPECLLSTGFCKATTPTGP